MNTVIDVDVSSLTSAEQRLLGGLAPLLNLATEGGLRLHDQRGKVPAAVLWRMQPNSSLSGVIELIHPGGQVRATLTRPIVLGALKRMMIELSSGAAPRITAPKVNLDKPSQALPGVTRIRPAVPASASGSSASGGSTSGDDTTGRHQLPGSYNLSLLLETLSQEGPGNFDIRFPTGESIRVDRGNHHFRCRGFSRSELYQRLGSTPVSWVQLSDRVRPKSEETQASMAPLLFVLGVITAKDRFIPGLHTELEFQITATVGYAKFAGFERIATAFIDYSPVPDAAMKLAVAPVEILACLNGYAAVGLLKSRHRSKQETPLSTEKAGFFSRLFSKG